MSHYRVLEARINATVGSIRVLVEYRKISDSRYCTSSKPTGTVPGAGVEARAKVLANYLYLYAVKSGLCIDTRILCIIIIMYEAEGRY